MGILCPVKLMMRLGGSFRLSLQKSRETSGVGVKAVVTGRISITSVLCCRCGSICRFGCISLLFVAGTSRWVGEQIY